MKPSASLQELKSGETTIRELRGITEEEFETAVGAARKLVERGEYEAAKEILAGLALYDPFCPGVWAVLEELFRIQRHPDQANLFGNLARAMAA